VARAEQARIVKAAFNGSPSRNYYRGGQGMPVEIRVPHLGESVVEATVGKWLKNEGDQVNAGEPLVELETEKVSLEVAAEAAGVLAKIESRRARRSRRGGGRNSRRRRARPRPRLRSTRGPRTRSTSGPPPSRGRGRRRGEPPRGRPPRPRPASGRGARARPGASRAAAPAGG
jgi:2-oxoglutarate dehydrogenase E2 component (dihydrolipoamide succinyltransferase)